MDNLEGSNRPAPTIEGIGGFAWDVLPFCNGDAMAVWPATLGYWLVTGPHHPFWKWWGISVVHLRPLSDGSLAKKRYPEAEYEVMILALDPKRCPDPDPRNASEGYPHLWPPDLCYQFHGVSDEEAAAYPKRIAELIVQGTLSPDSDFRRAWETLVDRWTGTSSG